MKYRIIEEVDGNNKAHYEVHFFKKMKGIFAFGRSKWYPVTEYKRCGEWFHDQLKKFNTIEEARFCVNEHHKQRSTVIEGIINEG
jgi:hypothetical protein